VLTYLHPVNNCSITRSSQPLAGFRGNRSIQDERLVEAIFATSYHSHGNRHPAQTRSMAGSGRQSPRENSGSTAVELVPVEALEDELIAATSNAANDKETAIYGAQQHNLIVDARPTVNAYAMQAVGLGSENMDNYKFATKAYLGIDNIHVMRDSLAKVIEAIKDSDITPLPPNRDLLAKSGWLKHIANLLDGAALIARQVGLQHSHVLIHCSDGWDRTSQLSALSQICLDPYYRTLEGFMILVEKDWLSFGHMFRHRSGFLSSERWFATQHDGLAGVAGGNGPISLVHSGSGGSNALESAFLTAKGFFNKDNTSRESLGDSEGEMVIYPHNGSGDARTSGAARRAAAATIGGGGSGSSNSGALATSTTSTTTTTTTTPPSSSPLLTSLSASPPAPTPKDVTKIKETSPVFHQFLDATYQLLRQHPTRFEFSERFLRRLLYHLYACQYGTFLYDSEKARAEAAAAQRTRSVWDYFRARRRDFLNPHYTGAGVDERERGRERLILPRPGEVRWWSELFGRSDEEMNGGGGGSSSSSSSGGGSIGTGASDDGASGTAMMSSSNNNNSNNSHEASVLTGVENASAAIGVADPSSAAETSPVVPPSQSAMPTRTKLSLTAKMAKFGIAVLDGGGHHQKHQQQHHHHHQQQQQQQHQQQQQYQQQQEQEQEQHAGSDNRQSRHDLPPPAPLPAPHPHLPPPPPPPPPSLPSSSHYSPPSSPPASSSHSHHSHHHPHPHHPSVSLSSSSSLSLSSSSSPPPPPLPPKQTMGQLELEMQ
jgi:hypothetical protein